MNRRRLLKSGAVLSTASVAGCIGDILPGNDSVFDSISRQGMNLLVNFRSDADIQQVVLVTPNGNQGSNTEIPTGESQAVLPLFQRNYVEIQYAYAPGTNTIVAVDNDGNEHEKEVTLTPRLQAQNISFLGGNKSGSYGEGERYTKPVIQVQNTGSAPAIIIESAITGSNVPNPQQLPNGELSLKSNELSADLEQLGRDDSQRELKNRGPQWVFPLAPGSSVKAITSYEPFGFPMTAAKMGKEANQQLQNKWGGRSVSATATLVERTGRLNIDFSVSFGGSVKGALTSGEDYLYFQNTQVTNTSIDSSG